MKYYFRVSVITSLIICIFTSCSKKSEQSALVSDKNYLVVAVVEEPTKGFDPCFKWPYAGNPIFQSLLFKYNQDFSFAPDLAESYTTNNDCSEYDIKIRKDAKFSDGVPVTAKDIEFTFKTLPKTATWVDYSFIKSVKIVDDFTVHFTLTRSNSEFLHTLTLSAIIPEHCYNQETYAENPIGSGPYVLSEWKKGEQMTVKANPYYYREKPLTETITFLFVNTDMALALAERGEVDVARLSVSLGKREVKGYTKKVVKTLDGMMYHLPVVADGGEHKGIKTGNPVFADAAIRKAVNIALDRQGIVDKILNGYGRPFRAIFEGTSIYNESGDYADNNPDEACRILEEAGWKDSDGDGIREKNGLKAVLELYSVPKDQTYSPRQAITLAVQQSLKKIGIEANIVFKEYSEIKNEGLIWQQGYLLGFGGNAPSDMYTYFHKSQVFVGTNNPSMYSNDTVSDYISEALRTSDIKKRTELWKKAQWDGNTGINIRGDAVMFPTIYVNHIYLVRDGVDFCTDKIRAAPHRGATWVCTEPITQWKKN